MAYSKTNWQNGVTPINETNLNKVEQGIFDLGQTVGVSTAGTDLNDYVDNGAYFFNNANTPTNKPSEVTVEAGYLEVIARNDNDILHRWTEYGKNIVWQRQKKSGNWQSWFKLGEEKNILTAAINNNTTVTVTTRYSPVLITLNSLVGSVGDIFTLENGKIKVNRNCTVKISASTTMTGNTNSIKIFYIMRNSSAIGNSYNYSTNGNYISASLSSKIVTLQSGDLLTLAVSSNTDNTEITLASANYTYLTVEAID